MSTFIWHNAKSKESAEALAEKMGAQSGTVPPKGFKGDLVCYGGVPSDKFKWETRVPTSIANDPRKTGGIKNMGEAGLLVGGFGEAVRIFCVPHKKDFQIFIKKGGQPLPLPPPYMDRLRAQLDKMHRYLQSKINPLNQKVATSPENFLQFFAVDGLIYGGSPGCPSAALSFIPTGVVLAPSITEYNDVLEALASALSNEETAGAAAKVELAQLIEGSSPKEALALKGLLSRLKAGDLD